MPAASDRSTLIAALVDEFDALLDLGRDLTVEQWDTPTEIPGWTVRDNYSHIVGTELMLLGRPDPTIELGDVDYLRNDIGRFNEMSIVARRGRPGAAVLEELAQVLDDRRTALAAMSDADFDAESFTPAGKDTFGRFMQIRVFDCWIHEQDCRVALGLPGHLAGPAATVTIDEMTNAVGFIVGKKAGATEGQSVRFELTGPTSRTIDVRVDGRATVVADLNEPTATITMPVDLWVRYAAGRRPADVDHADVALAGDIELGRRVVANLAYTI